MSSSLLHNSLFQVSDSQYLHCDGRAQSAVTHTGNFRSLHVISLQWSPGLLPSNTSVTFTATVVR